MRVPSCARAAWPTSDCARSTSVVRLNRNDPRKEHDMRHGITGMALGLVVGIVIASGAAFALGADAPGGSGVVAASGAVTPASFASVNTTGSVNTTRSVETTRPVDAPAMEPRTPPTRPGECAPAATAAPCADLAPVPDAAPCADAVQCPNDPAAGQVRSPEGAPSPGTPTTSGACGMETASVAYTGHYTGGHTGGSTHR